MLWESPQERPFLGSAFHPSGEVVAVAEGINSEWESGAVYLWNWKTGQLVTEPLMVKGQTYDESLKFSPDGRLLAAGTRLGWLSVFEVSTGETLIQRKDHTDQITSVDFTADGAHLLTASYDGTIRIIDLPPIDYEVPIWVADLA